MKRDLRIVFMGTPDFAVATLAKLLEHDYTVVGVITAPDKPAGRGRKLQQSAVKKYALLKDIPVLQPTNLKDDVFVDSLAKLDANLQIVVAFRMLPKVVWQLPRYGTFNLHASLLPNYRGAAPINWAIINGETITGVTTFFIDEKIDTGAIIAQKEIPIAPNDNAGSLHDKLMHIGGDLVINTVIKIENDDVTTVVQPEIENNKTAYKIHKNTCKIDWTTDIDTIYNKIRGLSPYPASWSLLHNGDDELTVKIYDTEIEKTAHTYNVGDILVINNILKVAVANGFLIIKELQLPGKRKMDVKSLLNGYTFHENAKMS